MKKDLYGPLLHLPPYLYTSTSSASSRPVEPPAYAARHAVTQGGWRDHGAAPSPAASQRVSHPLRHGGGLPAAQTMMCRLSCSETSWCTAASDDDRDSSSRPLRLPQLQNSMGKVNTLINLLLLVNNKKWPQNQNILCWHFVSDQN